MNIGIIGTGRMGRTCAQLWTAQGHTLFLGSREAARGQQVAAELGEGIQGGSQVEAAAFGDVILFAFPWYALVDVERSVGDLAGKIIIDCINPLTSSGSLALGHKWSAGEEIGRTFPKAQVVKGFNTVYVDHLANPLFSGRPATLYYASDSDAAKQVVAQLAQEMGFTPQDCGPLKHARYLEPLATFWIHMAFRMGWGSDFTLNVLPRNGE